MKKRLKRKRPLAGLQDDPGELLKRAEKQATSDDELDRRNAADTAHLAIASAISRTAQKELTTKAAQKQIRSLASEAREVRKLYRDLYEDLHVKCFYRGDKKACSKDAVVTNIELAKGLVSAIEKLAAQKGKSKPD